MNNTEQIYREYKLGVKDMARAVKEFQKLVNKCDSSFDNTEVYLSDMETVSYTHLTLPTILLV